MYMYFDESGNLGKQGRYFTIACVCGENLKSLKNVMKKSIVKTRKQFPKYSSSIEIKASDSNPAIKDYFLRKISTKDIDIKYITADLEHVNSNLLEDENLLYNFMLKFLILPTVKNQKTDKLTLILDKRTIKVGSTNSFSDYIKIAVNYDLGIPIEIDVHYLESRNSVLIQAADFVANAIYSKYEFNNDYYYNIIKNRIDLVEHFPRRFFGTDKVVNIV